MAPFNLSDSHRTGAGRPVFAIGEFHVLRPGDSDLKCYETNGQWSMTTLFPCPFTISRASPRADPRLPSPEPPKMLPAEITYHLKLLPRRRLRTELTRSNDGARANEVDEISEISDRLGRFTQLAKGIRPLPLYNHQLRLGREYLDTNQKPPKKT